MNTCMNEFQAVALVRNWKKEIDAQLYQRTSEKREHNTGESLTNHTTTAQIAMQSSEEEPPAHFRTTNLREPLTHTLRVETMSTKGVICSFASYLILFVIALIIGYERPLQSVYK